MTVQDAETIPSSFDNNVEIGQYAVKCQGTEAPKKTVVHVMQTTPDSQVKMSVLQEDALGF